LGFSRGAACGGKSFWDKKFEGAKEDRAAIAAKLAEIKEDLATGGTRRRYEELNAVKNNSMRPFWEHLGFKSRRKWKGSVNQDYPWKNAWPYSVGGRLMRFLGVGRRRSYA